ncbi:MAG: phenylacetate-CoA oxygenase subunit PaaI, partial [Gemmatimonadetes bacterium]|nr:phenylacetate-CoA oxygenase subunit PaaI [Gemmatimonadota bacterium]
YVAAAGQRESAYGPFRHRAKKMLQEEQYHLLYADGWLETLAAEAATRTALKDSLNRYWTETLAWFGPDDDPIFSVAAKDRILDANGPTLRGRFVEELRRVIDRIDGLGFPEDRPLPWDRWNADKRRLG